MKILMFGWEFPPHISGGLGTASYGLTKGLAKNGGIELIFVVPKLFGDEDHGIAKLIGAGNIKMNIPQKKHEISQISQKTNKHTETYSIHEYFNKQKNITKIEINSILTPYLNPETFKIYLKNAGINPNNIRISKNGKILYKENNKYKEIKITQTNNHTNNNTHYNFSGKYGPNLIEEVKNYAKIASKIALTHKFDIIHAHDWLTYLAGIEAKKATGKPLVIHVHATEFDRSGENVNQTVYDIERTGMDFADKIITVSNLTKNIVKNKYGQNPQKITTIYNAVEPIKRKIKYKKTINDKIVTFLGRITYQKGPSYFIEAAKLVLQKNENVRFVMAGSGDMFQRMIKHAAAKKIMHKFHFTNFLKGDDVTRMFDISDVFVMPSVSEPFGISPLEAMRANVPVIISKQSGVAEILKHAIKIDFWDTHEIAEAIYGLTKYKGLAKMFQKYGKNEVDNLKWENSAKKLKKTYQEILKTK